MDLKLARTSYRNLYYSPITGLYYVRKMVNGRSRTLSTGEGSLGRAERRMHEIILRLNDKTKGWDSKEAPSLREWWKDYRQAKKKSARTWHREEEIMDLHILPILGRYSLDQITQNMVERHLNKRRKEGSAEGTVTREQSLLHAVLQAAVDDDLIVKNPMKRIPRTAYATRKRVVSSEEQDKLQVVLSPMMERWFLFMLGTGIRLEEVRGIKPSRDMNLEERQFRVVGKGHNGEPKERWVPLLDPELLLIVKEQIGENNVPSPLHRMNRFDTLWAQEQSFFRKELTRACKVAQVPYFSPHTLRHTFATRYLRGGGDIFVLSQILGHASVDITQKVYAHLLTKDHAKLSEHIQLGIARKGKIVAFPAVS